jgi:chloramphenicol 3-O-phosphotransferase
MGKRNYLIEGVSGAGKTAVCTELQCVATRPFMVTGNWCIEALRKRVYRRLPGYPSIRFGM